MLTHGSLFSGIGGFDLGFERAGIETIWQVEIEDYARRVLARHFPRAQRFNDIRECGKHNLAAVDIVSGGFPCQDISNAGHREGIDGERSGLWVEYSRIIRELRPRFVVVENVAALLIRGMERVLGDLAACGYDAEWDCLPAAAFGAPHIRDRVWILAYPGCESRGVRDDGHDGRNFVFPQGDGGRVETEWGSDRELVALVPGVHPRTPENWWRAQSYVARSSPRLPGDVDRLRGIGNSVVPQISEWIGRRIVAAAK